jgi:hypothetical protein
MRCSILLNEIHLTFRGNGNKVNVSLDSKDGKIWSKPPK